MSLRYCLRCHKINDNTEAIFKGGLAHCSNCEKRLIYFGREPVKLSSPDIISDYDKTHDYDPMATYKGRFQIYFTPQLELEIMECEDVLINQPDNQGALLHLGTLYRSRGEFEKAKKYLLTLLDSNPEHIESHKMMADIFLQENEPESAISALETVLLLTDETSELCFNLGLAYVMGAQFKNALKFFKKAHDLTESKSKQSEIKAIASQIKHSFK